MYRNQKVSIVLPVYNEKQGIRSVIDEFLSLPEVDEVVAVDNNSTDGSGEEIKKTRAKYVYEPIKGYGSALQRGMREASGDIIITLDSDSTYFADDLEKLLIYSNHFDAVFCTRTNRQLISPGAFMPIPIRLGNWGEAKMIGFLFDGPTLTEVGCTFKLVKRSAYEKVKDSLTVKGSYFSPQLIIRLIQNGVRCVEIPVRYRKRVGSKGATGTIWSSAKVGIKMGFLILRERIQNGKKIK